ncbi:MAG TPA: hypothetical protein VFC02_05085 [Anaerolineales bacterium]|nr:hypothetical protein [Anaerolineales bacterium]
MLASISVLILGDLLAIGLVTLIGFATHGEADMAFVPRMAASTFHSRFPGLSWPRHSDFSGVRPHPIQSSCGGPPWP